MAHTTKIKGAKGRGYTAHCLDCDWIRLSQGRDDRRRDVERDCARHHAYARRGEAHRALDAGEIGQDEWAGIVAAVDAELATLPRTH